MRNNPGPAGMAVAGAGGSAAAGTSGAAATGGELVALGDFPAANRRGTVSFVATGRDGVARLCLARGGEVRPVLRADAEFASFRGALVDAEDGLVFFATPRGGRLGVFFGPDPAAHRLFGLGDPLFGSASAGWR